MKEHMVVHGGDTPILPPKIIINILTRLPIKSLIRFKCVCKDWKNLMKPPSFIAEHLYHHANQNPSSLPFKRCGDHDDPLNLFVADCEMRALDVPKPPFKSRSWRPSIIGTCNCLICVKSPTYSSPEDTHLFLWNPATKEVRQVPGVIDDNKHRYSYLGFGFNPIVNDYKIVRIVMYHEVINRVELYSLNTDSWKEIEFGNIKGVQVFYPNA